MLNIIKLSTIKSMFDSNLANLTAQYQQAYMVYCYKVMQQLCLLAWLEQQQNQEVKQKSALRGKNFDSQPNQKNLTFKSLKHKEKTKVKEKHATGLLHEAFGEVDYQLGTIPNNYLFTGEQYDNNVGFYYLRARFYNPSIGRFLNMDTFQGRMHDPKSLHKYLYAKNNPVMFTDPSGNITLGEISTAQNVQGVLRKFSFQVRRVMRIYEKFDTVGTLIELVGAIRSLIGGDISALSGIINPPSAYNVNFSEAATSFGYNLPRAIGVGMFPWAKGISNAHRKGKPVKSFLLFLPSFGLNFGYSASIPTGLKVRYKGTKTPIKIVLGGPSGSSGNLFGMGIKTGHTRRQLIRMDSHSPHSDRVGSGELDYWVRNPFHYHAYKWASSDID